MIFEIEKEPDIIMELVKWIVPFLLGLFASLIIDKIRNTQKRKRNKKFILLYLKNTILSDLPHLEKDYTNIRNKIKNYSEGKFMLQAFESFNSNVLKGIEQVEYYDIFKKEYTLLNEIISMIEFLSKNLPSDISDEYYDYINSHLREKKLIGDIEHVKTCRTCKDKQYASLRVLESRIKEVNLLKEKIERLTK